MNRVFIVTIRRAGVTVFQFVVYDHEGEASHLAGHVMDRFADADRGAFDYLVTPAPFYHSMSSVYQLNQAADAALDAANATLNTP